MTVLVVTSIILGLLVVAATVGIPIWLSRPWAQQPDYTQARQYLADKAAAGRPAVALPGPRLPAEARTPHKTAA